MTERIFEKRSLKNTEDSSVIRFIQDLLLAAVHSNVSDIHFEPFETKHRIRFRQDGILYEHSEQPLDLGTRLASCIKVMAKLDISEKRTPQDGHYKLKLNGEKLEGEAKIREINFRVSTCPVRFGEKIVMRVLETNPKLLDIHALGMEEFQKNIFLNAINKPQGLILVTGPTGCGKTVTLYTALNLLNDKKRNISSCEDPVEIDLPGINQVSIHLKSGMDFPTALRAFLRQDPDIIMVGEIRDFETADIAVKAAQTGHLVLSTLHTNSAAEAVTRLKNIGIQSYNLATSLSLVIAQRLVRKLCEYCKIKNSQSLRLLRSADFFKSSESIGSAFINEVMANPNIFSFNPFGCEHCKEGFKGREALYEMLPITESLQNIILRGGETQALYETARSEGMWNLKQAALNKVTLGVTALEEVARVVGF